MAIGRGKSKDVDHVVIIDKDGGVSGNDNLDVLTL